MSRPTNQQTSCTSSVSDSVESFTNTSDLALCEWLLTRGTGRECMGGLVVSGEEWSPRACPGRGRQMNHLARHSHCRPAQACWEGGGERGVDGVGGGGCSEWCYCEDVRHVLLEHIDKDIYIHRYERAHARTHARTHTFTQTCE